MSKGKITVEINKFSETHGKLSLVAIVQALPGTSSMRSAAVRSAAVRSELARDT